MRSLDGRPPLPGHRRRRAPAALAGAGVLAVVSAGCASSSASSSPGPPGTLAAVRSGTVPISVRDNTFVPQEVTVTVGSRLVWRNDGRTAHDIVPVGDTPFHIDTGDFGPKATYEHVADAPGTYRYYCSIHGTKDRGMIGTVQVVEK